MTPRNLTLCETISPNEMFTVKKIFSEAFFLRWKIQKICNSLTQVFNQSGSSHLTCSE